MARSETYDDLVTQVQGLFGATLTTAELSRLKVLANQRAYRIFRAYDYWPETLIEYELRSMGRNGEIPAGVYARDTSDNSFSRIGLEIDTLLRVHKERPFKKESVKEYEFVGATVSQSLFTDTLETFDQGDTAQGWFIQNYSDVEYNVTHYMWPAETTGGTGPTHDTFGGVDVSRLAVGVYAPDLKWGEENPTFTTSPAVSVPGVPGPDDPRYTYQMVLIPYLAPVKVSGLESPTGSFDEDYTNINGEVGTWFTTPQYNSTQYETIYDAAVASRNAGTAESDVLLAIQASIRSDTTAVTGEIAYDIDLQPASPPVTYVFDDDDAAGPFRQSAAVIKSRGVYCTYKRALHEDYGNDTGETSTIPQRWFNYIAHGTYADLLRADGQVEKAMNEDAFAQKMMDDEIHHLELHSKSRAFGTRISTNAAAQGRNTS